jgi:hypothetical protein
VRTGRGYSAIKKFLLSLLFCTRFTALGTSSNADVGRLLIKQRKKRMSKKYMPLKYARIVSRVLKRLFLTPMIVPRNRLFVDSVKHIFLQILMISM